MELTLWELLKLCTDVGLVVLIWMVQLVIYPSFCHFGKEGFDRWHHIYMKNITFIVLPLMLGQLILSGYLLYDSKFGFLHIVDFLLVGSMWLSTALFYKPLHEKLVAQKFDVPLCQKLDRTNWWRTIVWSLIAMLTFYNLVIQF
ncbi:hypothetical protein [Nonlabens agnitus]|uniref:DUF4149 domain-containing protein n=1 Tax=Nonlabens agnitus TaxID=870484 RepID=A0A2S9WTG6_9FLAO|nr:hypothetical protein [Nonlabens agnitus]PRP66782.1 hypothetical protein BST86_06550 [Nonlabens agnitus]